MNNFEIKSVESNKTIIFENLLEESFSVKINSSEHSLNCRIDSFINQYGDLNSEYSIPDLFKNLAENWRGWKGKKVWHTFEKEFAICATSDQLGHISLKFEFDFSGLAEPWNFCFTINTESGLLESINSNAESFFNSQKH